MILWTAVFFLYLTKFQIVHANKKYVAIYKDEIVECDDPGSRVIDFSQLTVIQESGSDTHINGDVIVKEDIHEGTQIKADVNHEVDGNDEFVFSVVSNICSEMNNTDTPWYPIINGMGINKCPIKKGVYHIDEVSLDISDFADYMRTEYCGDYTATMSFIFVPDEGDLLGGTVLPKVLSCNEFTASIFEVNDE